MQKFQRSATCPCGSGKQFRHCCFWREVQWVPRTDGKLVRKIPVRRPLPETFILPIRQPFEDKPA